MELNSLTLKNFIDGIKNKKFSAKEVAEEYLKNIETKDKEIHAYLEVRKEKVLVEAAAASGVLSGAPLALKDNLLLLGERTTAASKILENYVGAYEATAAKKLREAGGVFLGKTNLDEFAMGSSTENSAWGTTRNPYDLERVAGGSSGGSAAAVAAEMALAALGSDTGGSIRQPAAFCGVVGLKPTYGAVSRHGLIAMASSLDQIGPIAKTVEDAAILFDVIRGKDEYDATSLEADNLQPTTYDPERIKNLKIGIPKEYFEGGLSEKVQKGMEEAIKKFKDKGLRFKEISLPHTKYALSVYYIIQPAEVSSNLARFDGIRYSRLESVNLPVGGEKISLKDIYFKERGEGFGAETKRRILLGTFVLSAGHYDAYYSKAQKVRRLIKEDFDKALDLSAGGVDVIFAPTTPTTAFKIGEKANDPLSMYLSDILTIPADLAGIPAVSIPVKTYNLQQTTDKELPVGFQLMGRHFREEDILGLGRMYEAN